MAVGEECRGIVILENRRQNQAFLIAVQGMKRNRQVVSQSQGGSSGSTTPGSSNINKNTPSRKSDSDTKAYIVTSDVRANQTADEARASGDSSITVRGDDGTFTVGYRYNYPSSYLISAGRGKSLVGKSVSIQFDGEKAALYHAARATVSVKLSLSPAGGFFLLKNKDVRRRRNS